MKEVFRFSIFIFVSYWLCTPSLLAEKSPADTFEDYLTYWQSGEYSKMYDTLSSRSKVLTSRWEFIAAHEKMESRFNIIDFSVYDYDISGNRAEVWYSIATKDLFGDQKTQDKSAHLLKESNEWKIQTDEVSEGKKSQLGEGID